MVRCERFQDTDEFIDGHRSELAAASGLTGNRPEDNLLLFLG